MQIRRYQPSDAEELRQLFFDTIRTVNLRDYSEAQVQAWAPEQVDMTEWHERLAKIRPFVCVIDDVIAGYADVQPSGLIDHFYVHHQRQRQGVGRCLMQAIHDQAARLELTRLHSHVSKTARPFFEAWDFRVVKKQQVSVRGQVLTNYVMEKSLT